MRFTKFTWLIMLVIALLGCQQDGGDQKEDDGHSQPPRSITLPARLESRAPYTSQPTWSSERDYTLQTTIGSIRVFNPSDWQLDTALLTELLNKYGVPLKKSLDLRLFNENFTVQDPTLGFDLSDQAGDIGQTVDSEFSTWVIIPTGWASKPLEYIAQCPGAGLDTITTTTEMLITMDIVHELLVHGLNRSAGIARTADEECVAQAFERHVFRELNGRALVRKP